jgi:hypothetical protein
LRSKITTRDIECTTSYHFLFRIINNRLFLLCWTEIHWVNCRLVRVNIGFHYSCWKSALSEPRYLPFFDWHKFFFWRNNKHWEPLFQFAKLPESSPLDINFYNSLFGCHYANCGGKSCLAMGVREEGSLL